MSDNPKFSLRINQSREDDDLIAYVKESSASKSGGFGRYVDFAIMYGEEEIFHLRSAQGWSMMPGLMRDFLKLLEEAQTELPPSPRRAVVERNLVAGILRRVLEGRATPEAALLAIAGVYGPPG